MLDAGNEFEAVWSALSEPRLAPYLKAATNKQHALSLYEWNTRIAAACFEVVGHLEVLMRNSLDQCLRRHYREDERGIPWFFLDLPGGGNVHEAVDVVRRRLRQYESLLGGRRVRDTRHQIVAGMSFGFWSSLTGPKYETLWRDCLHSAFPNSPGTRKEVSTALEGIRKFRNRLAHHDSMIGVDVPFEIQRVFTVARFIDADAAAWLEGRSRVMDVYAEHPGLPDTVVVAAKAAWPLYASGCAAYVCQAGRSFRHVERIAFYAESEIKPDVPKILHRRDNVDWTLDEADRLAASGNRFDRKIAEVIRRAPADVWDQGRYQIFLLSREGDPAHRKLPGPLAHEGVGRGSAFTQRQRYIPLHSLQTAKTTADLG